MKGICLSAKWRCGVLAGSVAFLILMLSATSARAIFGIGDEVFDPTMYASQLQ